MSAKFLFRSLLAAVIVLSAACSSRPVRVDCSAHLRPINPPDAVAHPTSGKASSKGTRHLATVASGAHTP